MSEKIFAEGIYLNKVNAKAPDYIISSVSIHVDKAIEWLQKQERDEKGYVKLTGKEAKNGKRYFEVDKWKPTQEASPSVLPDYPNEDIAPQDIPF
jgi:hypothetical protein